MCEIDVGLDNLNPNVCVKWTGVPKRIVKKYRFEYYYSRGADAEILKGGASQVNSHNDPEKIQNKMKFGTRFCDGLRSYPTKIHQGQFFYHVFKLWTKIAISATQNSNSKCSLLYLPQRGK